MHSPVIHRLLLAVFSTFVLSTMSVRADLFNCGVDLGAAGRTKDWALLSLGGGVKGDDLTAQANVYGDVGAAGNGDIDLSGNAIIHGDLYYHTPGQLKVKNNGTITGATHQDAATDALLNQAVTDAMNASNAAFALPVSPAYASVTKIDRSMTITGSGCVVLKLTDFMLDKNDVLTLTGTAGTAFIINITKSFSLHGNAQIVLSGGIQPSDVLFNLRGTGSDAVIDGKSRFRGILMANQRTARLDGDSVSYGEIIANHIDVKHNAIIKSPAVASE